MSPAFDSETLVRANETLFAEPRVVRFQDVDAAGIVFYPRVLEYFHDVYVTFLTARGIHLPRMIEASEHKLPLVHAEADYHAPMRFGDALAVEIVAIKIGKSSFQLGYRIRHAGGRVAAVGQTAHVCVGLPKFAPVPLPDDLRAALESRMA